VVATCEKPDRAAYQILLIRRERIFAGTRESRWKTMCLGRLEIGRQVIAWVMVLCSSANKRWTRWPRPDESPLRNNDDLFGVRQGSQ